MRAAGWCFALSGLLALVGVCCNVAHAADWPAGTKVAGRIVDHAGVPVANAEVLLLGEERLDIDGNQRNLYASKRGAVRRSWAVLEPRDAPDPPSTRTDDEGKFSLVREQSAANRLLVFAKDPIYWAAASSSLPATDNIEIRLPRSGSLAIHCDLPGKANPQPLQIELRTLDGVTWGGDLLRFGEHTNSVENPGQKVFEHLPPGWYAVERNQSLRVGERMMLMNMADRQLVEVKPNEQAVARFERTVGRPLVGHVRGLEQIELSQARVTIQRLGPEEEPGRNGKPIRLYTVFDVLPIKSDGQFTTDPIPPGQYTIDLFAVHAATPASSLPQTDFVGQTQFTVPADGEMPQVVVAAKPNLRKQLVRDVPAITVVDEAGKPVEKFAAMFGNAGQINSDWNDGRDGRVELPSGLEETAVIDVLFRAQGYAPALVTFTGEKRTELLASKTQVMLQRGKPLTLRYRVPEGMALPDDFKAEIYWARTATAVHRNRQPYDERVGEIDFDCALATKAGEHEYTLRMATDSPEFFVAIHRPGFLRFFDAGPYRLADAREGVLEIDVPRPASVEVAFNAGETPAAELPFQAVSCDVMWRIPGTTNSYLPVMQPESAAGTHTWQITDLAPGNYMATVRTEPNEGLEPIAETEINPGRFADRRTLALEAGKVTAMATRYVPFNPDVAKGDHDVVVKIRARDSSLATDKQLKIGYFDGHYGILPLFEGPLPASGEVELTGVTDRVSSLDSSPYGSYWVTLNDSHIGDFNVQRDRATQVFEFQVPVEAGDAAPDIELADIKSGQMRRLSSLRGRVVLLEFWASWCGPCQPAMQELNKLAKEHRDDWGERVSFVALSIDDSREIAANHVEQRGWNAVDQCWTGEANQGSRAKAAASFVIGGVPTSFLIDQSGKVVWRGHLLAEAETMAARIEKLLDGK